MNDQSRRTFLSTTGLAALSIAAGSAWAAAPDLTIGETIDKIIMEMVGRKFPKTVDTLKCGDPAHKLVGITITFFATISVIEKAIELGHNLIITHEPTFYNHQDEVADWLEKDDVYQRKIKLLNDHQIAVWRCHDYIHTMRPDGIVTGMINALEWQEYRSEGDPLFHLPEQTLTSLVQELKDKLDIAQVRIVGDPQMEVKTAGLLVGAPGGAAQMSFAGKYQPDVLICGEISEWETSEYMRDANLLGQNRALVVLGHIASEQEGMRFMANWLTQILPSVKVEYLPVENPFVFM